MNFLFPCSPAQWDNVTVSPPTVDMMMAGEGLRLNLSDAGEYWVDGGEYTGCDNLGHFLAAVK